MTTPQEDELLQIVKVPNKEYGTIHQVLGSGGHSLGLFAFRHNAEELKGIIEPFVRQAIKRAELEGRIAQAKKIRGSDCFRQNPYPMDESERSMNFIKSDIADDIDREIKSLEAELKNLEGGE